VPEIRKLIFLPDSSIGQLCEDLNEIVGQGIYYNKLEIQNTKRFGFVSNMVTAMSNNKILCGCFGMYPRFVTGILKTARRIHYFVLCNAELNCENCMQVTCITN